jgi:hypothetical protein
LLHHRELTDAHLKQLQLPERQRKHLSLNHAHLKHLRSESDRLIIESLERDVQGPKLVFVTATFVATEEAKPNALPIPPSKCFKAFERFYVRLLSELMHHYNRPGLRHLQPLTYAFIDYPGTKRKKSRPASNFEKLLRRLGREHPEMTPHIHALMLIHPDLVERFEQRRPYLEFLFQSLEPINRTLHICKLSKPGDDERVLAYSSECVSEIWARASGASRKRKVGKRREKKALDPDLQDVDLFMWFPKARSEPLYQRLDYERELERGLAEDRLFRRRHVRGVV